MKYDITIFESGLGIIVNFELPKLFRDEIA